MLKSAIEQTVKKAVDDHVRSESVSKDELADILTDVLCSVLTSTEFIKSIDESFSKLEKQIRRGVR